MNYEWQDILKRLNEGTVDFKTIRLSIKNLAESLRNNYIFMVSFRTKSSVELVDDQSLNLKMKEYLEQTKLTYLQEQRRSGRNIPTNFEEYMNSITNKNEQKKLLNYVKLSAWQRAKGYFLEVLCLLASFKNSQPYSQKTYSIDVFRKVGPIPILKEGKKRYIWCQPSISKTKSGMYARADIAITNSNKEVSKDTIISLIECKCKDPLSSTDIRKEFGKAVDLEVESYRIVAYHEVKERFKIAAKQLGINIIEFGLYTSEREKYIQRKKILEEDLSENLLSTYKECLFRKTLSAVADSAESKSKLLSD